MKPLSYAVFSLLASLAAADMPEQRPTIDLGGKLLSWKTAIYVDGFSDELYINYASEVKLKGSLVLRKYD